MTMLAVAIQEDDWDEGQRTAPATLADADERAIVATLAVLEDPALAHPAAALAALLRHFATADEPALRLQLASERCREVARDGVRAAFVDLGVR
jgi:predicted PhzF superfamily epimerase YddE/YHI9